MSTGLPLLHQPHLLPLPSAALLPVHCTITGGTNCGANGSNWFLCSTIHHNSRINLRYRFPNESTAAAALITSGVVNSAAITTSTDNDYFKITTTATSNIVYNLVGPSGVDF